MNKDISLEALVSLIKEEGAGLSQVKMASKFGVSRRRIQTALKHSFSIQEASDLTDADEEATITTTDNGCVSIVPSSSSPVSVGDVFTWGKTGDNKGMVTWVNTETKELAIIKIGSGGFPEGVLELVTFRNWKKRKNLNHESADHEFIFCQATAKDEGAWAGDWGQSFRELGASKSWVETYQRQYLQTPQPTIDGGDEEVKEEVDRAQVKAVEAQVSECPYRITVSTRSITIVEKTGAVLAVTADEGPKFEASIKAMEAKDWALLHKLCAARSERADDYQKIISRFGFSIKGGYVVMNNGTGQVALGGIDAIMKRLEAFSLAGNEQGVIALGKFVDKLLDNPDPEIMNRVVDFIRFADVEIDENGDIITYKYVDHDYKDSYSRKLDNRPGAEVFMKRILVDKNIDNQCSEGLHVCALSYVFSFWSTGKRLVRTRLSPRDIVAIPRDYKGAKIRTCRYSSIDDVTDKFLQRKIPVDFKGFFS